MAQHLDKTDKSVRILGVIGVLVIALAFISLCVITGSALNELSEQRKERQCAFDLVTETDKIDSEIQAKQAQIFEAAILRPAPGDGTTDELRRLGNELHTLLGDRTIAFDERANAEARCT